MKRFTALLTGILILTCIAGPVLADKAADRFLINGKPVPEIMARVNGSDILSDSLVNEVKAWRIMAERKGAAHSPKEEKQFVRRELDRVIDHELLYQKSQEMKIKIPTATIQKEIENLQKRFPSRETFLTALAFQRLTVDKLATRIEKRLAEEEFLRKKLAPLVQVSDGMVEAYYDKNKSGFRTPVKYRVSHIFTATISPGEGAPEDPADREKARRMVRMINGQAKVKIEDIESRLKKGGNFSRLCKTHSEDDATRDKGGSMGEIELEQTLPQLASAIAGLKPGEISGVVESPYGYHILKLDGKIPDKQISLNDMRSDILNVLLKKELEKKREEYLRGLRKKADIKTFLLRRPGPARSR